MVHSKYNDKKICEIQEIGVGNNVRLLCDHYLEDIHAVKQWCNQCIYISSSIISSVSDLHTFYRLLAVLEMEFQISFLFGLIPPVKIFSYL